MRLLVVSSCFSVGTAIGLVGQPFGFAANTTGGGNSSCRVPKDNHELAVWLADAVPRCIVLDRTFDLSGKSVSGRGCTPTTYQCGNSGQDAIQPQHNGGETWCTDRRYPMKTVSYDSAGLEPLQVNSNKTILGIGTKGILKGAGLIIKRAKNVILQNVHITAINPKSIWGGDGLTIEETDNIWIDHCKFSHIGRQFIVTSGKGARRMTISNTEFDGRTRHSATCNNRHYWVMLFYGQDDRITFFGNFVQRTSGRGPDMAGQDSHGGRVIFHAVNNVWQDVDGHAFAVRKGGTAVVEGNVFQQVKIPNEDSSDRGVLVIGNLMDKSGSWVKADKNMSRVASSLAGEGNFKIEAADITFASRAGIGKLGCALCM